MKLRILSLCMTFLAFFYAQVKPSHPVFGFAPPPASSAVDHSHLSTIPSPVAENPFNAPQLPTTSPFGPVAPLSDEHEPIIAPTHVENPFTSPTASEPFSEHEEVHTEPSQHHPLQTEEHSMTTENPFMTSAELHDDAHQEPHPGTEQLSHPEEHTEPHPVQMPHSIATPPHEHLSTAKHSASIPTLTIVPGHSAKLAPLTGNEAEMHYVIQDKKYSSYLTTTVTHGKTEQTITIPATVHEGSFTVFKAEGTGIHPQSLQPAYRITITSSEMEGTQFPEEQTSSAVEKLKMLEDQYLATMQEHFKSFMNDLRDIISEANKTGESLALPKPPVLEKITTHPPITLLIGETKVVTSFAGGSAQSANPAIAGVNLTFKGSKEKPEWAVSLTAHKAGETTITYSTGTETFEQPVFVKGSSDTELITEEKNSSVISEASKHVQEPPIPLKQEGALASFLRADENLPGEAKEEQKEKEKEAAEATSTTSGAVAQVAPSENESENSLASDLEDQDKEEQEAPITEHTKASSIEKNDIEEEEK